MPYLTRKELKTYFYNKITRTLNLQQQNFKSFESKTIPAVPHFSFGLSIARHFCNLKLSYAL